ncbi:MAG: recombinase family protein [Pseudonocardiaceae bacterium]
MSAPIAISYIRWSSAAQSTGDSGRRQTEAAEAYCRANALTLDDRLFHDRGVSAFRGGNARTGALAGFLEAVRAGDIPRGSFLLIESWDRMSREAAYDAQKTLRNIIEEDITVVTLGDGKRYSEASLRADPMELIYSVLLMSRAHEESKTKGDRVAKAWGKKRDRLTQGHVLTRCCPGWMTIPDGPVVAGELTRGRPVLIDERAEVVREVYRRFLAGGGKKSICRTLNERGVKPWGHNGKRKGAAYWGESYIAALLKNVAVTGVFVPHREESDPTARNKRGKRRVPQAPIVDYFPRVISNEDFERVQQLIASKPTRGDGMPTGPVGTKNVLGGLGRCGRCGAAVTRISKGSGPKAGAPRLVCTRAMRDKAACTGVNAPLPAIESALIAAADAIVQAAPGSNPALAPRLADAQVRLAEKAAVLARVSALVLDVNAPPTIVAIVAKLDDEHKAIKAEVAELERQVTQSSSQYVARRVDSLRAALQYWGGGGAGGGVADVNAHMRLCFDHVVVRSEPRRLELHWLHGIPPAVVTY